MVKIRLKKFGTQKRPYYRVVVMDERSPRDGRAIEEIGTYMPIEAAEKQINIDVERAKYWLGARSRRTSSVSCSTNRSVPQSDCIEAAEWKRI